MCTMNIIENIVNQDLMKKAIYFNFIKNYKNPNPTFKTQSLWRTIQLADKGKMRYINLI